MRLCIWQKNNDKKKFLKIFFSGNLAQGVNHFLKFNFFLSDIKVHSSLVWVVWRVNSSLAFLLLRKACRWLVRAHEKKTLIGLNPELIKILLFYVNAGNKSRRKFMNKTKFKGPFLLISQINFNLLWWLCSSKSKLNYSLSYQMSCPYFPKVNLKKGDHHDFLRRI